MNNRYGFLAGAVLCATALAVAACAPSSHDHAGLETSRPLDVRVSRAAVQNAVDSIEIGGDVRARDTATMVSRIMAEVREVCVKAGDRVRAGQTLVLLDARDLVAARTRTQAGVTAARDTASLAAAERQAADASLALASATYARVAELRAKNSATPHELDEATAGLHAAEARVKAADAQIAQAGAGIDVAQAAAQGAAVGASYATITAPFDGVVTQKLVEPGNMASPGAALLTIEDTRAFRLEIRIDESRAALVKVGATVDVAFDTTDGPGEADAQARQPARDWQAGRVAEISRGVDPSVHAFLAKIDLPAVPDLRSGMFGRARFAGAARRILAMPAGSIVRSGQLTSIFVVDRSNTARLRLVTLGETLDGQVEVRAGLDPGETVIVDPPFGLLDGMPVRPIGTPSDAGSRKVGA
jgi:RND family efflux transporter MFP subunit